MKKKLQIAKAEEYVKNLFCHDASGHDLQHLLRVRKMALLIAQQEGGNLFLIEMAALLHDVADWKFLGEEKGAKQLIQFLLSIDTDIEDCKAILNIVQSISFKGAKVNTRPETIEAMIVQDSDRLDAIGAIGIARAFAFGGAHGRMMYDFESKPQMHQSFEEYKSSNSNTFNHFHEKLLLLKNRMNTATAKSIAEERHLFMEEFLLRFFNECEV